MKRFLAGLSRVGIAASSTRLGGSFYHVVCRRIDRFLIPLTAGRMALGPPGQTVLLTTTGARSGHPRRAAVAFGWDGDDMVVIASKGGSPHHPAWYHNLKANPLVRTQYRDHDEQRVAREVIGEDRERLFSMMAAQFPNFTAYQERAARTIPVMVLSRT